ncbi:hypothetical protein ARMGADRAFT_548873 [Armillaria gallica]|uniref:Uncharacterized protein n=1 Tax=Armillaria gallica TaxID=47427 RepID=A0A2H3CVZ5_ARMGA|nr:hypothetical protein ARMGADRAFT_548873 [Armillaria gallica]
MYDVPEIGESWTDPATFGSSSADTLRALPTLDVQIIKIPDHCPTETIVVRRKDQANLPCVINPHGGPHEASRNRNNGLCTFYFRSCNRRLRDLSAELHRFSELRREILQRSYSGPIRHSRCIRLYH